jgi:hypothetical protein
MPPPSLRPSYALPWRLIEDQNRATLTPWGGCLPVSSEPCVAIIRGLATDVRQLSLREGVEGASSQWLSQRAWQALRCKVCGEHVAESSIPLTYRNVRFTPEGGPSRRGHDVPLSARSERLR